MNKVFLIGRIVKDLELKKIKSDSSVCEFTLAVNRDKENADFINCVVWNKQAENLSKYHSKGSLIAVLGEIRTEQYEIKDQKKYKTYVLVNNVEYLSKMGPQKEKDVFKEFGDQFSTKFEAGHQIQIEDSDLPF